MIDIRELRRDPDAYLARLARKGAEQLGRDLLEIDAAWRRETATAESLRAEQKRAGKPSPDELSNRAARKERLQEAQALLADLEGRRKDLLDRIPNPPAADVPDGGEDDFTVVREVGEQAVLCVSGAGSSRLGAGQRLDR
jgi:seryl-tRNA synthetase